MGKADDRQDTAEGDVKMFIVELVAYLISEVSDLFHKPKTIDQMTEEEYEAFFESHMGFSHSDIRRNEE